MVPTLRMPWITLNVITISNRTPGASYSDLWADFVCIHQLVLEPHSKVPFRQLAYDSFQLTHMTHDDHAFWVERARRKTLLQCSQLCHQGEFRHLSVSAQWHWWQCSQNLHGLFLRAVVTTKVEASLTWAIVADGKAKALIAPISREFQQKIIHLSQWTIVITTV